MEVGDKIIIIVKYVNEYGNGSIKNAKNAPRYGEVCTIKSFLGNDDVSVTGYDFSVLKGEYCLGDKLPLCYNIEENLEVNSFIERLKTLCVRYKMYISEDLELKDLTDRNQLVNMLERLKTVEGALEIKV